MCEKAAAVIQNNAEARKKFGSVRLMKMKLGSPMIVVTDMERSLEFYKQVLGLDVILDFGANKTLTTVSPCRQRKPIKRS